MDGVQLEPDMDVLDTCVWVQCLYPPDVSLIMETTNIDTMNVCRFEIRLGAVFFKRHCQNLQTQEQNVI